MEQLLPQLAGLVVEHGLNALLRIGGSAVIGLVLGTLTLIAIIRQAERNGWFSKSSLVGAVARWCVYCVWILTLPWLASLGFGIMGLSVAAADLVREEWVVEQAVPLVAQGAQTALQEARPRYPELAQEIDLGLRLAEGRELFRFGEIEPLVVSLSSRTVELMLDSTSLDEQAVEKSGTVGRLLKTSAVHAFVLDKVGLDEESRRRWAAPLVEELERTDEDGDGAATGHEIFGALARIAVQEPVARWTFWSLFFEGLALVLLAVGLILLPAGVSWLLRTVLDRPAAAPGAGRATPAD